MRQHFANHPRDPNTGATQRTRRQTFGRPRRRSKASSVSVRKAGASTVLAIGLVSGLSACSQDDAKPSTSPTSTPVSVDTMKPSAPPKKSPTLVRLEQITGRKTASLDLAELPAPPAGFNRQEVEAFAKRAIEVIERGIAPQLTDMTPEQAFDFVFATQYPETTELSRSSSATAAGRYDWEWAWASMFQSPPEKPATILAAHWQADTVSGTLSDGTSAPQLVLTLSATIQHLVPDPTEGSDGDVDARLEPIVVQRNVIVRGFRPLGGPDWWPGIGIQTDVLFGGKCALVNGSKLTVVRDQQILARDFKKLRRLINQPGRVETSVSSDADDLTAYVQRNCDE